MACKDSGRIIAISPVESGVSSNTGKDWRKVEVAIEWGDKFKNQLCLTAFNDKVDFVQNLSIGDDVTVEYTVSSRSWAKDGYVKWFHNVNLQSIDINVDKGNESYKPQAQNSTFATSDDDLPF